MQGWYLREDNTFVLKLFWKKFCLSLCWKLIVSYDCQNVRCGSCFQYSVSFSSLVFWPGYKDLTAANDNWCEKFARCRQSEISCCQMYITSESDAMSVLVPFQTMTMLKEYCWWTFRFINGRHPRTASIMGSKVLHPCFETKVTMHPE